MSESYKEGQEIVVAGQTGTVVKVMKSSLKADFGGKVRVVPFAIIEETDCPDVKEEQPKEELSSAKRSRRRSTPENADVKGERPARKRQSGYVASDEEQELNNPAATDEGPVTETKARRYSNRDDEVAQFLSQFEDPQKLFNAVSRHDAKGFLNKDAMAALKPQVGVLGNGLVRMRLGNMLRAAIKKQQASK